jgi:biopolymer transport protein ExbB
MQFLTRLIAASFLLAGSALAQQGEGAGAPPPPGADDLTLLKIVEKTGFLIWPLLALSIAAVFLIIFYFLTVRRGAVVSDRFMNSADALIRKQDYLGLLAVCNRQDECISRVTAKTLDFATKNPTASFDEVREVTQAEGSRQASLLHQRIQYLADIGAVAPMIGLLGTVIGMIKVFSAIMAHGVGNANQLAGGISEALITTAAGLTVAIPSFFFYRYFKGQVESYVVSMEEQAINLIEAIERGNVAQLRSGIPGG